MKAEKSKDGKLKVKVKKSTPGSKWSEEMRESKWKGLHNNMLEGGKSKEALEAQDKKNREWQNDLRMQADFKKNPNPEKSKNKWKQVGNKLVRED